MLLVIDLAEYILKYHLETQNTYASGQFFFSILPFVLSTNTPLTAT